MLELQNIHKSYRVGRNDLHVLQGIDLTIGAGEPTGALDSKTSLDVMEVLKGIHAAGSIVPRNEIDIKPQVSGILDEIYVETGEQQFERRDIETGLSDGLNIQVVSGLSEDDRIKDSNSAA